MKNKILLIALSIIVFSCNQETENKPTQLQVDVKTPTVKVVHPELKRFTSNLKIIGNAKANKEVNLFSMEAGVVMSIKKDIGDKVNKGDVLAVLENPELSRQLIIHKAEMEVSQSNYLRLKSVFEKTPELTTINDFENIEATYKISKAKYQATKNRDSLLTIKAPFSGIVTQRNVEIGDMVQNSINSSSTTSLFQIMDMDVIRLLVDLPETEVDNISVGMKAVINFPELVGKEFDVKVSRMANMIDNTSKTMEVQIDIANKNNEIKSGMYAEVNIQLQSDGEKLSLPNEAIMAVKSEFFVYKVTDGIVEKILIKKGLSNIQYFEIKSDQISSSDNIIVEGKSLVKDGMKVNISE
ncbi:MAG: efflux RND transporter periplasmic adaptor subunit [Flavobacteriales bacterium]